MVKVHLSIILIYAILKCHFDYGHSTDLLYVILSFYSIVFFSGILLSVILQSVILLYAIL